MRSLPRQGSIPARLVRAIGPVAQDAFHRIDARHRCRTGLARARCSLLLARPTPVHPRRSAPAVTQRGRPVLPVEGRCRPMLEDVSHRLLQPILSTCTRGPAGLPASSAPCGASSARVEIRLTPSLQLPPRIDALLPEGSAGSGPALRRGRPLRPTTALSTRLLPPPVTRSACPFEQLSRPRTASASPSSKGAASAIRSGFIGSLPPAISFRRSRGGSSRPLQSPRLPSTNRERPGPPLAPPEVSLLRSGYGRPRVSRRATGRDARIQGPAGASRLASSSPTILSPGSFSPHPHGAGTSCHEPGSPSGWSSRTRMSDPPAGAWPCSTPGLLHPPAREGGRDRRTRGAFHQEAPQGGPRFSTGCLQLVDSWYGAFIIVATSFARTCSRCRHDPVPGWSSAEATPWVRSTPLDFYDGFL